MVALFFKVVSCCCHFVWLLLFLGHLSWKLRWAFLITCCPSVHLTVCKLFTFSSSSLEPLGQFQPNLAQSILGWMRFKFVQMNDPFSRGYNYKKAKIHWRNLKNLLKNHRTNVNQTWHKASLGEGDLSLFKWSPPPPRPFPREDNYKIGKIPKCQNIKIFSP